MSQPKTLPKEGVTLGLLDNLDAEQARPTRCRIGFLLDTEPELAEPGLGDVHVDAPLTDFTVDDEGWGNLTII